MEMSKLQTISLLNTFLTYLLIVYEIISQVNFLQPESMKEILLGSCRNERIL